MNKIPATYKWIAIIAFLACSFACRARAAENTSPETGPQPGVVRLALRFPASLLGRGAATVWDDLLGMASAIEKEEGIRVVILRRNSWADVMDMLLNGGADLAIVPPYFISQKTLRQRKENTPEPLAVLADGESTMSRYCIYMLPDYDDPDQANYKLDSLYGKRISVPDEAGWVLLNQVFRESNFRFEPYYFFRSFRVLNRESSALALLFRELDATVMDELSMKYIQQVDDRLADVKPLKCSNPLPNVLLVQRQGLHPELVERISKFLYSMHENPAYKNTPPYYEAYGVRWAPASETDLSLWDAITRSAARNGWDKSYMTIPSNE